MGTPEFAVPSLKETIKSQEVVAVYTQPDRPRGRGKKVTYSPVKECALSNNIQVEQPISLKSNEELERLKKYAPDVIVVVAYGKLLPKDILELPKNGCINVHASLLPKYRGAAPIHWAVMNGESKTGVTIMNMVEKLDAGPMLLKSEIPIQPQDTTGEIHDKLMDLGAEALSEVLKKLETNDLKPVMQEEMEATYAPMIEQKHERVSWDNDAQLIVNQIRGLNPWPGAYTMYRGKRMKLWQAKLGNNFNTEMEPGKIVDVNASGVVVQAVSNQVIITELQLAGKKKMNATEFVKGYQVKKGEILDIGCD